MFLRKKIYRKINLISTEEKKSRQLILVNCLKPRDQIKKIAKCLKSHSNKSIWDNPNENIIFGHAN